MVKLVVNGGFKLMMGQLMVGSWPTDGELMVDDGQPWWLVMLQHGYYW